MIIVTHNKLFYLYKSKYFTYKKLWLHIAMYNIVKNIHLEYSYILDFDKWLWMILTESIPFGRDF